MSGFRARIANLPTADRTEQARTTGRHPGELGSGAAVVSGEDIGIIRSESEEADNE